MTMLMVVTKRALSMPVVTCLHVRRTFVSHLRVDYGENSFKPVFLFDLKSSSFPVLLLLFHSPAILRKLIASEYVDAAMQKCSAMTKYKMVMFVFSFVETKSNKL